MKIILLISLIYTFIMANQTQIVLGSFTNEKNAKRHVNSINNFINKNIEFKAFFQSNALASSYKKDGKYFSVIIKPFNDLTTQKKVLDYLKPKFKDTYIILLPKVKKGIKKVKKIIPPKKETVQKKVIKQQPVVQTKPIKKPIIPNELNLSKAETKVKITEQKISNNEESSIINKIYLLIIFILLLVVYFLRKKLKTTKDSALRTIILDTPPLAEEILSKAHKKSINKESSSVDVSDMALDKR